MLQVSPRVIVSSACFLTFAACVSPEVNTTNPTTYDLLFRKDQLDDYLVERESELHRLQARLDELDVQLDSSLTQLFTTQRELLQHKAQLRTTNEGIEALGQEIHDAVENSLAARKTLSARKEQLAKLKTAFAAKSASMQAERDEQQKKIDALTAEVETLGATIAFYQETNLDLIRRSAQRANAEF